MENESTTADDIQVSSPQPFLLNYALITLNRIHSPYLSVTSLNSIQL